MVREHSLLKKLSLPLEEPRSQGFILVIIQERSKFSFQLLLKNYYLITYSIGVFLDRA
jgi:hypothetical protein